MFERFTDRARRVVVRAQEEARELGHNHIRPEHILLGLIRENEGVGVKALESLNVDLAALRLAVTEALGAGEGSSTGHIPFTPQAKKLLEYSLREALQLGHNYIGTEHILLAICREPGNEAATLLTTFGVDHSKVMAQTVILLRDYSGPEPRYANMQRRVVELTERVHSLEAEITRLTALLKEHGIDPAEPGAAGSAS